MFDYKAFADEMSKQSKELIPADFSEKEKKYISTTICDFVKLAGESLNNDKENDFSDEQKVFFTQVIAEWTFHKSVDLIRAKITDTYWNAVMQKIAFTIFEVIKQALLKNIPQEQVLEAVEHHVKKVYKECIEELFVENKITDEIKSIALEQSNIDAMAEEAGFQTQEISEKKENNIDKKGAFICGIMIFFMVLGLAILFSYLNINNKILVSIGMPFTVLMTMFPITYWQAQKVEYENITKIIFIMLSGFSLPMIIVILAMIFLCKYKNLLLNINMWQIIFVIVLIVLCIAAGVYFAGKAEINHQLKELAEVRQKMNDLANPDKMYERLGVDVVSLLVGQGLLCIADPDQEGQLLAKLAALRQRLTDELGYIIPNVRIMDTSSLKENEYVISIRQNVVDEGLVYPNKYMVILDKWNKTGKPIPDEAIKGVDPTYKTKVIWINKIDAIETKDVIAVAPEDVIITHLQEVLIQQVDKVLSEKDIRKCIDLVKKDNSVSVDELLDRLSYGDIRRIFVNLIKEKVSIKDITLVLSRLEDYSRFNKESDCLSERLRKDLSRQSSLVNCNENKKIFALGFSSELLENLTNKVEKQKGYNKTQLKLDFDEMKNLVETTANALMNAHKKIGQQPIILVNDELRLPLYRLLVKHIPTIVVLSTSEIEQDIKLEIVDTL